MLPKGLLREYSSSLATVMRLADAFCILIAAKLSFYIKFDSINFPTDYILATVVGVATAMLLFHYFGFYRSGRGEGLWTHSVRAVQAIFVLSFILAGFCFFAKMGEHFSRQWFVMWMSLAALLFLSTRLAMQYVLRWMRLKGLNERRAVIFGAGHLGQNFAASVQEALWTGFRVTTFIDDHADRCSESVQGIPVMQTPENLSAYLQQEKIDEVWIALPLNAEARVKKIMHELRHHTMTTRLVLDLFGLDLLNHSVAEVAGFPVLNIRTTPMMGLNRMVKALEDRVLAFMILTAISPLLLLIAIAVKLSSKGPVFYRQKRVGWNGKEFEMLKFRSMPVNAESSSGPVWAKKEDGRATAIGTFLRKTSLDELPQFINVLLGDMSIVGPRPERQVFVDDFKEHIPGYMQKHQMKAGITGWAQVHGWRGNTSLEKRIEFDLYYINHWSLWLDLKIIVLTVFKGFINRNAY